MSRLKKFTHSLVSGYIQMGVNVFYTLASVPLALHYLSTSQFGLWQVAASVSGYLLLIDFGITGASARILIDHKDNPSGEAYGSVLRISTIVFLGQGMAIALVGTAFSFWMPQLVNISAQFPDPAEASAAARALIFLTAGQCIVLGISFPARIFWNLCIAHQRYDLYNYTQVGMLVAQFTTLWIAFHRGWGVYSILPALAISLLLGFCCGWLIVRRAGFLPQARRWGKFDAGLFKEIFWYGSDQFMMAVGAQLINASQVLIISHALGLTAAAVWAVATKPFMLAQQLVGRIFAFSTAALAEMIVRNERDRFLRRFRDIVTLSVALAILIGGSIALCNESFLQVWTKNRISWSPENDLLLALWLVLVTAPGLHVFGTTLTKSIGRMRYVYFCEGLLFVTLAVLLAPRFQFPAIIASAIVADLVFSGFFGVRRTVKYFGLSFREVLISWMAGPTKFFLLFAVALTSCKFITASLPPVERLVINAAASGIVGTWLLWQVGLTENLRAELQHVLGKVRSRLPKWRPANP